MQWRYCNFARSHRYVMYSWCRLTVRNTKYKIYFTLFLNHFDPFDGLFISEEANENENRTTETYWRISGQHAGEKSVNKPIFYSGLTWINNHNPSKVWDEITYPFPNFNDCAVEVSERISYFTPHFIMDIITYPYSLWLENPEGEFPVHKWPVTRKMFLFDDVIIGIFLLTTGHQEQHMGRNIQETYHRTEKKGAEGHSSDQLRQYLWNIVLAGIAIFGKKTTIRSIRCTLCEKVNPPITKEQTGYLPPTSLEYHLFNGCMVMCLLRNISRTTIVILQSKWER